MEPFDFKDVNILLRPSKGRHFMSTFLKSRKFIASQSPLVDSETLKSKMRTAPSKSITRTSRKSQKRKSLSYLSEASLSKAKRLSVATQIGDGILSNSGNRKSYDHKRKIDEDQDDIFEELTAQSKETQKTSIKKNFPKRSKNESSLTKSKNVMKERIFPEAEEFEERNDEFGKLVFQSFNKNTEGLDLVSVSSDGDHGKKLNKLYTEHRSPRQSFSGFVSVENNLSSTTGRYSYSTMTSKKSRKNEANNLVTQTKLISKKTSEVNNNMTTLSTQANYSNFKTPLARAILDKYFPVAKKPVSSEEENAIDYRQVKMQHGKFGLPKLLSLPKDNLKRFERICEYIRDWNAVCKLNDAIEEVE